MPHSAVPEALIPSGAAILLCGAGQLFRLTDTIKRRAHEAEAPIGVRAQDRASARLAAERLLRSPERCGTGSSKRNHTEDKPGDIIPHMPTVKQPQPSEAGSDDARGPPPQSPRQAMTG
jgi:hypothetical protein